MGFEVIDYPFWRKNFRLIAKSAKPTVELLAHTDFHSGNEILVAVATVNCALGAKAINKRF